MRAQFLIPPVVGCADQAVVLAMAASISAREICSNSASRQPTAGSVTSSSATTSWPRSRSTIAAASRSRSERSLNLRCASSARAKISVASASKSSTASSSATASRVWNKAARVAVRRGSCSAARLVGLELRALRASRVSGPPARQREATCLGCGREWHRCAQMSQQLRRRSSPRRSAQIFQASVAP